MPQNSEKFKPTAGNKCAYGAMLRAYPRLKRTPGIRVLAETYIDLSEMEGHAFAGQEYLEFLTGYSARSIGNANIVLQELGLFSFNYRPNHSTEVTPNWEVLDEECALFLDREKDVKIKLRAARDKSGSAKSAAPDRQSLRAGSADSAGVISLGNRASVNPSSPKRSRPHDVVVLSPSLPSGLQEHDCVVGLSSFLGAQSANDNANEAVDYWTNPPDDIYFENSSPPIESDSGSPAKSNRHQPLLPKQWPVNGLDRLREIHPPLSPTDERFAHMMYYSAKRQFESTVSFDLIEALLAHDLQSGFRNDEGNLLVHRLGGWLERCRWEDDDELNGELNRQLAA